MRFFKCFISFSPSLSARSSRTSSKSFFPTRGRRGCQLSISFLVSLRCTECVSLSVLSFYRHIGHAGRHSADVRMTHRPAIGLQRSRLGIVNNQGQWNGVSRLMSRLSRLPRLGRERTLPPLIWSRCGIVISVPSQTEFFLHPVIVIWLSCIELSILIAVSYLGSINGEE